MDLLSSLFIAFSLQYDLPPGLLSALCYVESTHNISAVNPDDGKSASLGICQVKLKTAKWMGFKGTEADLMKPENNIKYAAAYLKYQLVRYDNLPKAVIAYNLGNAKGLTTSAYQRKVFKTWGVYHAL